MPTVALGSDFLDAYARIPRAQQRKVREFTEKFKANPNTQKTPFVLPALAHYEDKADDLAHALHEFVTIERLIALNDWERTHHAPPERRVLMGETLLVRYVEADQEPGVADQNRENERRHPKRKKYEAAFKAKNLDRPFNLTREQSAECRWSPEGLRVKLWLETVGIDCDLHEALAIESRYASVATGPTLASAR